MSQRELTRLEIIQRVKGKTLKQREAAELLGLTERQIKRLCKLYEAGGPASLASQRRGRPSNNRLSEKTVKKARQCCELIITTLGPRWPTKN
jgi:transposase